MFKLSYGADINMRAEISFTIGVVTFDVIRLLITFVNFRLGTVTKESEKVDNCKNMHIKN
jgi:hypothetical protein